MHRVLTSTCILLLAIPSATCAETGWSQGWSGRRVPKVIGDFFDGAPITVGVTERVPFSVPVTGFTLAGSGQTATLGFAVSGTLPDDLITSGPGSITTTAQGTQARFPIAEPFPPSQAPLSPGAEFRFDGGSADYVGSQPFQDGDAWTANYSYSRSSSFGGGRQGATGSGGVAVRRSKLAENNSPIPDSRVYLTYNFFNDVLAGLGDVNRYMVGFERACACNNWSVDVRIPFAATLDSVQFLDNGITNRGVELGNLSIVYKQVVQRTQSEVLSLGLGLTVPTADDLRFFRRDRGEVLNIENERFSLLPFLGWVNRTEQRDFQLFIQFDFDLNGNAVFGSLDGGSLPEIGVLNDTALLFVDASYSYWLVQCDQPGAWGLTGVAPTAELHYSTTLNDVDSVQADDLNVSFLSNRFDVLNATLGVHFLFGAQTFVTPAFVLPLREGVDEQFDFEFAMLVNRRF